MASWYNLDYFAGKYFSPSYFGGAVLFVPTTTQLTTYFEPDYFGLQNFNANYFSPVSALTLPTPTATTSIYFSLDYFGIQEFSPNFFSTGSLGVASIPQSTSVGYFNLNYFGTQDYNPSYFSPGPVVSNAIISTIQNASYFNLEYFGTRDFNPDFFSPGSLVGPFIPPLPNSISINYFDLDYFGTYNFNPSYFSPGPIAPVSPIIIILSTTSSYFDTDYFGATNFNSNYYSPGSVLVLPQPHPISFQVSFTTSGDLLIIPVRQFKLSEQIIIDGNLNVKTGKITPTQSSFVLSGDFNDKSGYKASGRLNVVADGGLTENAGRISLLSESFIADTNLRFTPGKKAKAIQTFSEDGNVILSAGVKTKTYLVCAGDGDFSEVYAKRRISNVTMVGDANTNITGNFLAGSIVAFNNDGNFGPSVGIVGPQIFPNYPYFQADGDLSVSDGLIRRAAPANFSNDGDLVINGGKLLSFNTNSFSNTGDFSINGIRTCQISMVEVGDGKLSILGAAVYAAIPNFANDGSYKQANGVISTRNFSVVGNGDYSQITVNIQPAPPAPNTFDGQGDLMIGGIVTAPLGYIVNFILTNAAENSVVSFTLRRT
jgi:hypothetical protein